MKKVICLGLCLIGLVTITGCKNNLLGDNGTLYPVEDNNKWGYVNEKGKIVIEPQYETAYGFYEGLAAVVKDNKMGYINNKNEFVIEPQYELPEEKRTYESFYKSNFHDGIASVLTGSINECIYIDKTGKNIFDKTFYQCWAFDGDVARVMPEYGETIYIDKNGNEVEKPKEKEFDVKVDYKWIGNEEKYFFVKKDTREKINDEMYDRASDFNKLGYSVVQIDDAGTGIVDTTGKYIVELGTYNYFDFDLDNENVVFSSKKDTDGHSLFGLYDLKNKKELVENKYSNYYIYDDVYIFREVDNYLIVKKDGTKVVEFTL